MPLRDHFHPPLSHHSSWDLVHGQWPAMMVLQLNSRLPRGYAAGPLVHLGSEIEIDVGSFQTSFENALADDNGPTWRLPQPSVAVETELLKVDNYEVQVYDVNRNRRLVAAVEIVSPSNKDRPETRQVFVAKCEALLRRGVSVAMVDLVTDMEFNLYADLLNLVGQHDATFQPKLPAIYAAACRWIERGRKHVLETWSHALHVGQPLPTLPIWIADNYHVPLDLETTYEDTCRALRITESEE